MTTIATRASETGERARLSLRAPGLSGRLILITMAFVLLAQVVFYIPSAIAFMRAWLSDRIMGAQMIALAIATVTEESARNPELERKLVTSAGAIGIRGSGTPWLLAGPGGTAPTPRREIDLRSPSNTRALIGLARNLFLPPQAPLLVIGPGLPGHPAVEHVELLVDQAPLKHEVIDYTARFLVVSLLVSAFTGALLYLVLHVLVVRPVRRLSANIAAFGARPEEPGRVFRPSGRTDEIGAAEEALARMEATLAGELRSKRRLADLGLAVSKINHELRNMLTTAQLLGDRLGTVEDPTVRRIAPRLIRTLARATEFCGATLAYGRASEREPRRVLAPLKPMVEEQLDLAELADGIKVTVEVQVSEDLMVDADPDQLGRVLLNLMRNAVEAMSRAKVTDATIMVAAERRGGAVAIRVSDNGPGVPERARARLFSAFQASERSGGTGLGLPVADEIVRLHGGSIELEPTSVGASFLVIIPDRPGPAGRERA